MAHNPIDITAMADQTGVTRDQLVEIAVNSFSGSFLPKADKARHIADVRAYADA